jgi:hypothetical protein
MLNQIAVVTEGQKLPFWIGKHTLIHIKIGNTNLTFLFSLITIHFGSLLKFHNRVMKTKVRSQLCISITLS